MKNPLQPKHIPWVAAACGVVGFLLRLWLYGTGIDQRGLLRPEHPANALIFLLVGGVLLMLFLGLRSMIGRQVRFKPSLPAAIGSIVAAVGIFFTDLYELSQQPDRVAVLSCVLGALAAVCLVIAGLCQLRKVRLKFYLHGCLTVYLMIHLVSQYRIWSAEPQLQEYFFQLMASIFLMLSAYHRTTLDARIGNPRLFAFFNYGALFFCCLALKGESWLFYLAMAIWAFTGGVALETPVMLLPKNVRICLDTLKAKGYSAYVVGGCVRDAVLGLEPQDYDMCTCATPEQIAEVFAEYTLVRSGEKHGTIGVVMDGEVYEITTFRTEGTYTDSRHPDWVEFVTDIKEDLARRDFTVNAMAYDPSTGIIDPWGGQADLKKGILRTVGEPEERFQEDALRILRGVRFAVRFRLTPEESTLKAMGTLAPLMDNLARERVLAELCKLIIHATAEDLVLYKTILTQVIPELSATVGFQQHSPHHAYDVYTHTAKVVGNLPPELPLRLAALLHDIGKPASFTTDENGRGHFYGHAEIGAKTAADILLRLKAPNALRSQVVFLIEHHMTSFEPDKKLLRRRLGKYGTEAVEQLLALQKADYAGKGVDEGEAEGFARIEALLAEIQQEDSCLSIQDLAIDGNDLIALGFTPGPAIGQTLQRLLAQVQDEQLHNEADALRAAAENMKE